MTKKKIVLEGIRWEDQCLSLCPMNADITHNVSVRPAPNGAIVTLTPNREGMGKGWDTLALDIRQALLDAIEIDWDREIGDWM